MRYNWTFIILIRSSLNAVCLFLLLTVSVLLPKSVFGSGEVSSVVDSSHLTLASEVADRFDYPIGPPDGNGYRIIENYQDYAKIYAGEYHAGIDWQDSAGGAATVGDPVFSVANGDVVYENPDACYPGGVVIIKHQLPDGEIWYSMYAHLARILVDPGHVDHGIEIGTIMEWPSNQCGATGGIGNSHLHFEIRKFLTIDEINGVNADNTRHRNYLPGPGYWPSSPPKHQGETPDSRGWANPRNFIDQHRIITGGTAPVTANGVPSASSATVLVVDVSGSMNDDIGGTTKLAAAQRSGSDLLNVLIRDRQATGAVHSAGVVAFQSGAQLAAPLGDDLEVSTRALNVLQANGGTNMGDGLEQAVKLIEGAPASARREVIVLSDGATNQGISEDQILAGPAKRLADEGVCLSTIGFGSTGVAYDEPFLRRLGGLSPCGGFYTASDAYQLGNVYLHLSAQTAGTILREINDSISLGQHLTLPTIAVPFGQAVLHATLNWPGSTLGFELVDPRGRVVDASYPGAQVFADERPIQIVIANPRAGDWHATVTGIDVSQSREPFNVVFSSRPVPVVPGPRPEVVLALAVGAALLVAAIVVATSHGPRRVARSAPRLPTIALVAKSGPAAGRRFFLSSAALIGRTPQAKVMMEDPWVSRVHARLLPAGGIWLVEDLGSEHGTFVNGRRVRSAPLRPGDRLRIGKTELLVEALAPALSGRPRAVESAYR